MYDLFRFLCYSLSYYLLPALQRFELDEPQYGEYVRLDLIGYVDEVERIEEEKERRR